MSWGPKKKPAGPVQPSVSFVTEVQNATVTACGYVPLVSTVAGIVGAAAGVGVAVGGERVGDVPRRERELSRAAREHLVAQLEP